MSESRNQTDGPADTPPPGDGTPGEGYPAQSPSGPPREDEVSILDILLVLVRHKAIIVSITLVFTLLGLTYSLVAAKKYTSTAKVVRESQGEGRRIPGGISAGALSGLGIGLGGGTSGLTPAAYPEVLRGREVRLGVVRDTFNFPGVERPMTFVEYANRPPTTLGVILKYTLKLPWTLKNALGDAISEPPTPTETSGAAAPPEIPSGELNTALKSVEGMVLATVEQETGLMSVSVTAGGPRLAAELTASFVDHLRTRVREIRTEKVRERLDFVRERFREAEKELETAENRLAQFLERNQNPTTATLQFQRDRLQRQVRFKEQLYSELQSQLTQTRLDLQRRQPVVTVVEKAVPPTKKSAPQRTIIVLLSFFLGGIFGVGAAFGKTFFENAGRKEDQREKLKEIKRSLAVRR